MSDADSSPGPPAGRPAKPGLWRMALEFLRIGAIGFGGGVGMLALMREALVRKRGWIDDHQLGVAVAMGQMLPGPFVPNYAEYIGYELHGLKGMTLAVVFLLTPCFLLMVGLSFLYAKYGAVPVVERMFLGVQPVVAGILAWATVNIGRAHLRDWRSVLVAAVGFGALLLKVDVLLVVPGCGLLGILLSGAWRALLPRRALAVLPPLVLIAAAGEARPPVVSRALELSWVFFKIGLLIFGGGFAAIPFIQREVVDVRHWLTAKQFIDGVALGQMTPGPVAITATFIGYQVLGVPGALLATIGVFLPSFILILVLIHVYRRVKDHPLAGGFLSGVMPAVTGMLLSATLFIGRSAISGPAAGLMALLSLALLLRLRVDPIWLVLGGAALGLVMPGS